MDDFTEQDRDDAVDEGFEFALIQIFVVGEFFEQFFHRRRAKLASCPPDAGPRPRDLDRRRDGRIVRQRKDGDQIGMFRQPALQA
jgi:hypothetical protein